MKIKYVLLLFAGIILLPIGAEASVRVDVTKVVATYTDQTGQEKTQVICADVDCGIGDGAGLIGDKKVIRAGDTTGKMVPIVGGDVGRQLLSILISRSNNESLSVRDQQLAQLMQRVLINRWFRISQD